MSLNKRDATEIGEAKAESYDDAHEQAVAMGYPSLTEALEHLEELRETATEQGASVQEVEAVACTTCGNANENHHSHLAPFGDDYHAFTTTPSRIAPTAQEILELAREDWATIWFDNPAKQERIIEGAWDQDTPITSRVSVLTLAVEKWCGK